MPHAAPVLLPQPWLSVEPLYPGGFFPPLRPLAKRIPGDALGTRLRETAEARLRMDWPAARSAAEHAAAQALEAGSADGEADALGELAACALLAGRLDEADALYRRMGEGDAGPGPRLRASLGLAVLTGIRGDYEAALSAIAAAEAAAPVMDDADLTLLLANRSAALLGLGRLLRAEQAGADALRAGRRLKDDYLAAIGGFASALAHLARGRRNDARTRLAESVRAFTRAGDVLRQVQCHHLLGEIAYDGEDPIRAGAHYRDGLGLARSAGATGTVEVLTLRFEHR
jgi:tetratricopeptide (TPR) repeat protein